MTGVTLVDKSSAPAPGHGWGRSEPPAPVVQAPGAHHERGTRLRPATRLLVFRAVLATKRCSGRVHRGKNEWYPAAAELGCLALNLGRCGSAQ
jgi:hypothetical protein